jgi:hypothetical protein
MQVETGDDYITVWVGGQADAALYQDGKRIDLRARLGEVESETK